MQKFSGHITGVDQGDVVLFSDFEHDGEMWRGEGPRQTRQHIDFSERFGKSPAVMVSISMWDFGNDTNVRADVQAENITASGFEIVFRTWADTQVARVRVAWTAIGELPNDDGWDLY